MLNGQKFGENLKNELETGFLVYYLVKASI